MCRLEYAHISRQAQHSAHRSRIPTTPHHPVRYLSLSRTPRLHQHGVSESSPPFQPLMCLARPPAFHSPSYHTRPFDQPPRRHPHPSLAHTPPPATSAPWSHHSHQHRVMRLRLAGPTSQNDDQLVQSRRCPPRHAHAGAARHSLPVAATVLSTTPTLSSPARPSWSSTSPNCWYPLMLARAPLQDGQGRVDEIIGGAAGKPRWYGWGWLGMCCGRCRIRSQRWDRDEEEGEGNSRLVVMGGCGEQSPIVGNPNCEVRD